MGATLLLFNLPAAGWLLLALVGVILRERDLPGIGVAFGVLCVALLTPCGLVTALFDRARERAAPPPSPSLGHALVRWLIFPLALAQVVLAFMAVLGLAFASDFRVGGYLLFWEALVLVVVSPLVAGAVWSFRRERRALTAPPA